MDSFFKKPKSRPQIRTQVEKKLSAPAIGDIGLYKFYENTRNEQGKFTLDKKQEIGKILDIDKDYLLIENKQKKRIWIAVESFQKLT